uniref:hypothetical protein n=1 Tax=Alistipes sp. TaxID=1872444 RepID=UPI004057A6BF
MPKALIYTLIAFALLSCTSPEGSPSGGDTTPADPTALVEDASRKPFYKFNPVSSAPSAEVTSDEYRLEFSGWGSELPSFTLNFPEGDSKRVIMEYTMGSFGSGPAEYDYTTMIFVKDRSTDRWHEITRAITPFGGMFDASWEKSFYIDVTEFRSLLQGDVEFAYFYGGFDATEERAHSFKLRFLLYDGTAERELVGIVPLYDSFNNGNSGYRGWAYGVEGHDIEAEERLGTRRVAIPKGVTSMELRLSITGHGHDKGTFPDIEGYQPENMAEFVENWYSFDINGIRQTTEGHIFYSNADNYIQMGTYNYDRANWAPGNPTNVQYWTIDMAAVKDGELEIDLDLPRFESSFDAPNAEGVAQYIVVGDLFLYR